jgi:hypothetical protein
MTMLSETFTPEHPDFETLETREADPEFTPPPEGSEDLAQQWTHQVLFDRYND